MGRGMKCSICGKKIHLSPSAEDRAKKYGKTASYYTRMFQTHADCIIRKRSEDTLELIRREYG